MGLLASIISVGFSVGIGVAVFVVVTIKMSNRHPGRMNAPNRYDVMAGSFSAIVAGSVAFSALYKYFQ